MLSEMNNNIKFYLGDCREVLKGIEDNSIDLIYVDPPYNCGKKKFEIKEKSYKRICQEWDSYTKCEYINYFSKGRVKTFNYDLAKKLNNNKQQRDLLIFKVCQDKKTGHPSQKPLALMKYLIEIHSKENDIVLDPFLGSGTTGIACKLLNRKFIGIEMNKEYLEIAVARIKAWNKEGK